jgi:hypothetical protein
VRDEVEQVLGLVLLFVEVVLNSGDNAAELVELGLFGAFLGDLFVGLAHVATI